ncbi:hypothetical protein CEXT_61421 [Caerostris extrusa]|uniref:Uncharacterized protein n=1 Tax=Caerostris extrusa TaxID=172846 RepID=A0AAV4MLL9_CAEEX|nr:hypothetical protein CEXT_61421 [Caerostris extrusa]
MAHVRIIFSTGLLVFNKVHYKILIRNACNKWMAEALNLVEKESSLIKTSDAVFTPLPGPYPECISQEGSQIESLPAPIGILIIDTYLTLAG